MWRFATAWDENDALASFVGERQRSAVNWHCGCYHLLAMRLRAVLEDGEGVVRASCLDLEASGEGATREQALASLRAAIEERLTIEAVAPPRRAPKLTIDIVVVEGDGERRAREPTGPGDAAS
ncbi:MAG: hypothetical protein M3O36_03795 [Myxococcota bacterium]|nr:hypothetical protein [Myxococcota bacterium]